MSNKSPIKIVISGAAGQIAYSLLPMLCNGNVFGKDQPIILNLLDIPSGLEIMKGVSLELQDSGYELLSDLNLTINPIIAFKDVDVAILLGGFPRREGMDRKDLIDKNVPIFKSMGNILNEHAKSTCKVLVVANPANTNCLVTLKQATNIPKENFTCLTMLDYNRAKGEISRLTNKTLDQINKVVIWGNHSKTQYPDVSHLDNIKILDNNEFIKTIQTRGDQIIKLRKLSSAMSAAKAISDHLRIWLVDGTQEGEYVSLGVYSNGAYGISNDIIFSFPCECKNGDYTIVGNLTLNQDTKNGILISEKELLDEKKAAGY